MRCHHPRPRRRGRLAPATALVTAVLLLTGCGVSGSGDDEAAASTTRPGTTAAGSAEETTTTEEEGRGDAEVPTSTVTISDPVNDAFTAEVPEGWDNVAYSTVEGQVVRQVINSVSPDGGTVLFVGDPKVPSFWNPDTANEMTVRFAEMLDSMELARYVPAEDYVVDWVTTKFGDLPGFSLDGTRREDAIEERIRSQASERGMVIEGQVATAHFSYEAEDGTPTTAAVTAATLDGGAFWSAELYGASTDTGDVEPFLLEAAEVASSRQANPAFTASLQQRHNETMAMIDQRTREMTQRHEANMQWIQDSANAHQQRMQSIWAANDASMSSYYDRMAAGDVQQRQFLNYINDERTVLDSGGTRHQVDDSYQRYWMNPSTGQYYGGDVNFGESQLRELGADPSSFEEVQIVKG